MDEETFDRLLREIENGHKGRSSGNDEHRQRPTMTSPSAADVIVEPELREIYHYWSGKRGGRCYPTRADIRPEEIKRLLPFVLLLDVLDEGRHFRFRLVGTDAASGIDPTGKLLHEAAPGGVYLNHLSALFSRGAAGPGALYNRSSHASEDAPGPRH